MKTNIIFKRYIKNDPLLMKEFHLYFTGKKEWFLNGKLHREDGPAIKYSNGYKEWWLNGEYHREGGPAVEYANGTKYWYLNGKQFFLQKEYWEALEKYKREKNIK